jgi:hypothetical protein
LALYDARETAIIRFRPTLLQRGLPGLLGALAGLTAAGVVILRYRVNLPMAEMVGCLGFLLIMALMILVLQRGPGVTLTPGAVTVHNFGAHVIEWRSVAEVTVEKRLCCRTVVIRERSGREIRPRAPRSCLDRKFDEKVQVIYACWLGDAPILRWCRLEDSGGREVNRDLKWVQLFWRDC